MESQFDELAGLYENMATWPFRQDMEIPTVLGLLGDLSGRDVLDFGCGTGMYSRWIKERGARRVVGYDVSEGMLAYARRREEKERLGLSFASQLTPDLEAAFDVVLSVYVLPYATTVDELAALCAGRWRFRCGAADVSSRCRSIPTTPPTPGTTGNTASA